MTINEKVKLALRITGTALDDEITDNIEAARAELLRSGVSSSVIEEEGELIVRAIKTYVKAEMAETIEDQERFEESFKYQEDCLRKAAD